MGEERKRKKSSKKRKKKRTKRVFEWSKVEELKLLKKLVDFCRNEIAHEELYPFLRNGTSLAEVSKIEIFNKIQELKNKYLEKLNTGSSNEEEISDECFELSKAVWMSETTATATATAETTSERRRRRSSSSSSSVSSEWPGAVDEWYMGCFKGLVEIQALDHNLFAPSFLEQIKDKARHLFHLHNHHFLTKSNLTQQIAQLKYNVSQDFLNQTN